MPKIITCSELRHLTLAELEALFRTLQIDLGRAAMARRTFSRLASTVPRSREPGAVRPSSI